MTKMITTTTIDAEIELPKVEKMLFNLAWKCANAYPVTFEEARSEAYYAFMRACQDYNPIKSKGAKFSSWCYFWVWTHLKTFVTKRTVDPLTFIEIDDDLLGAAPPTKCESLELIDDLSEDAKEIVSLLVETPGELLGGVPVSAKQLLTRVKTYLVEQGRDKNKVDRAHRELQTRFQEAWAT